MEDVIVIGGGVIGTSILYHLAKKGVKGTLLEKKELASGTSGKCDGNIQRGDTKPGIDSESSSHPATFSDDRAEGTKSPAEQNEETVSASSLSQLSDQKYKYQILRIIASVSAISLGGAAGFYMIRRR